MNILKYIKDNTLIICDNNYKEYILKTLYEHKLFLNVKIISKKEFFNEYLFKYNEKTLNYLVNKYNYKVSVAKMYLDNLYNIEDMEYSSNKLKFLVNLKKELEENNLLNCNKDYLENIKKYNILVMGYPYLEKYELDIFRKLNANIIDEEDKYKQRYVYEFNTQEEEVNYVCKSICALLKKGISINDIKLVNVSDDYYNIIERLFSFYNIPVKLNNGESLYGNIVVQKFLNNYTNNQEENIKNIQNENKDIVKKIINICNKYAFETNALRVKKLIIEDLKNTLQDNFNLKNYIEIKDLFSPFTNEYVFLLNFNISSIPKTFKDEDYITDNIKNELNMYNTLEKNKIYKNKTINKIQSIKNLVITYKLKGNKGDYYPSSLINDLNLEVLHINNDIYNSYSKLYDKINYAILESKYQKYGTLTDDYYIYKNTLGNISYNTYDNKFSGINNNSFKEYLNNKLTLSYSSLNNYNKCAFKYYIANILKLDKYEENFEAFIGSLFHDVLEKCFNHNLVVEEEIDNYIKDSKKELTIKEKFFVKKITEDIKFAINILNKQKEYINLDKSLYEENIVIEKDNDIKVEFVGFIDKILYKEENDKTLISIIDYKTGTVDIELKYLPYGLSLQLPIYLYLVKNSRIFKNPEFVGFYLQYILDKNINRDIKKDYLEEKENNLKLMGYSNSNIHNLVEFDNTYENSKLIKGMKVKVDGNFSTYAKVLNNLEIDKIISLTESNIDMQIKNILDGNFTINPKKIGYEKDMGCLFCKFRDICYRKEEDYLVLEEIDNLDFLGGNNAKVDE